MSSALLKALADCGEKDLEEIDGRIGDLESELASLKAARKVVEARLGMAPKRGGKRPAGSSAESGSSGKRPPLRNLIHDLIAKEGPGTIDTIAAKLRAQGHQVTPHGVALSVKKCDWFEEDKSSGRFRNA